MPILAAMSEALRPRAVAEGGPWVALCPGEPPEPPGTPEGPCGGPLGGRGRGGEGPDRRARPAVAAPGRAPGRGRRRRRRTRRSSPPCGRRAGWWRGRSRSTSWPSAVSGINDEVGFPANPHDPTPDPGRVELGLGGGGRRRFGRPGAGHRHRRFRADPGRAVRRRGVQARLPRPAAGRRPAALRLPSTTSACSPARWGRWPGPTRPSPASSPSRAPASAASAWRSTASRSTPPSRPCGRRSTPRSTR